MEGAPKGIIVVQVVMPMGNKRCKIIVHNVISGQYAIGSPDVTFVAWTTNVANAKWGLPSTLDCCASNALRQMVESGRNVSSAKSICLGVRGDSVEVALRRAKRT